MRLRSTVGAAAADGTCNKVPASSAAFRILKALAAAVDEAGADFPNEYRGFGSVGASLAALAPLAAWNRGEGARSSHSNAARRREAIRRTALPLTLAAAGAFLVAIVAIVRGAGRQGRRRPDRPWIPPAAPAMPEPSGAGGPRGRPARSAHPIGRLIGVISSAVRPR